MSRRRPSTQPLAEVHHPQDPTIKVNVRKPQRIEAMRYGEKIALRQRATLVYDKDNNPAYDLNGNPLTHVQQLMPVDLVLEGLETAVVGWEGVLDDNDTPIKFSKQTLSTLFEEWLDCKIEIDRPKMKDGQPVIEDGTIVMEKREITIPFGRYISIQVAKNETFDNDPKTNGSVKQ